MAKEAVQWETFSDDNSDEEEALSLCDLPLKSPPSNHEGCKSSEDIVIDFEFRSLLSKDMCVADDIFFKGQILPLRPSVSSNRGTSVESENRRSFSIGSNNSNSNSSSSYSSRCISRSHSSSSYSSNSDAPRKSVSNNFYAHPSPSPQVRRSSRANSSGRKSTGSAPPGWSLFRLGVVKAPEIEISDLRSRRSRTNDSKCGTKEKKVAPRFIGFGCKCEPDAVEPIKSSEVIGKKKKDVGLGLERGGSMCRSRMFEWLEELSIGKGSVG